MASLGTSLSISSSVFRSFREPVRQALAMTCWSRYNAIKHQQYHGSTSRAEGVEKREEKTDSAGLRLSDNCVQV